MGLTSHEVKMGNPYFQYTKFSTSLDRISAWMKQRRGFTKICKVTTWHRNALVINYPRQKGHGLLTT